MVCSCLKSHSFKVCTETFTGEAVYLGSVGGAVGVGLPGGTACEVGGSGSE